MCVSSSAVTRPRRGSPRREDPTGSSSAIRPCIVADNGGLQPPVRQRALDEAAKALEPEAVSVRSDPDPLAEPPQAIPELRHRCRDECCPRRNAIGFLEKIGSSGWIRPRYDRAEGEVGPDGRQPGGDTTEQREGVARCTGRFPQLAHPRSRVSSTNRGGCTARGARRLRCGSPADGVHSVIKIAPGRHDQSASISTWPN